MAEGDCDTSSTDTNERDEKAEVEDENVLADGKREAAVPAKEEEEEGERGREGGVGGEEGEGVWVGDINPTGEREGERCAEGE